MGMNNFGPIRTLGDLLERLYDPDFDVSLGGWAVIDVVKSLYQKNDESDAIQEMVQQLLLRLIVDCPHIFAISVGQFPGYEGIEKFWEKNGYYDGRGFLWIAPETFGPYNMTR